jgi:hypothetical protein
VGGGLKFHLLWIILGSMFLLAPERWVGFFVVGCVLALFFFPLAHGPFQATHGPTTAFRAGRQFLSILYSLIRAAFVAIAGAIAPRCLLRANFVRGATEWLEHSHFLPSLAILRC